MPCVLGVGATVRFIHVLRKPLSERSVATNTLKHGTGGLNIDASRISAPGEVVALHTQHEEPANRRINYQAGWVGLETHQTEGQKLGRWPANVILHRIGGPGCPVARLDEQSGERPSGGSATMNDRTDSLYEDGLGQRIITPYTDTGGASRFYKQIDAESE